MTESPANAAYHLPRTSPRVRRALTLTLALAVFGTTLSIHAQRPEAVSDERQLDVSYTDLWQRGDYQAALAKVNELLESSTPPTPGQARINSNQLL